MSCSPLPPPRIFISAVGCVSTAGLGITQTRQTLLGLRASTMHDTDAVVRGETLHYGLLSVPASDDGLSRTEQLLRLCLQQMTGLQDTIARLGAERVAVVLGASTSGMRETELAMIEYAQNQRLPAGFDIGRLNLSDPARSVARFLNVRGPCYTISNACASGAMAAAAGARLLQAGLADAVITGGVDGFSRFTTEGFMSLGAVSAVPCTPFCAGRQGINLGEGGALLLLTRETAPVELAGWAESSDAYHVSSPDPQAKGAVAAMQSALTRAGLQPSDVDYICAHGTATALNDAMESLAIHTLFGSATPVSSLKHLTGHTLAGAGALQAAFACALMTGNHQGRLPANMWQNQSDDSLACLHLVEPGESTGRPLQVILSNAFAFGGSNACLIFRSFSPSDTFYD